MSIPYILRGQAIVERQNQALKSQLQKQKGESLPTYDQLKKALFTLNILAFSKDPAGANNSIFPISIPLKNHIFCFLKYNIL